MILSIVAAACAEAIDRARWEPPRSAPAMPRGKWSADPLFATRVAARRSPLVFRDALTTLPLLRSPGTWSIEDVAQSGMTLSHVRVSSEGLFEHYPPAQDNVSLRERAGASLGAAPPYERTYDVVDAMSAEAFFAGSAATRAQFMQYSRHILDWEETALFADLSLPVLRSLGVEPSNDDAPRFPEANLWLATAGASSSAHWDAVHNFFVQLAGTKRFTVWATADAANLHPYPALHPSWFKSQIRDMGRVLRYRRRWNGSDVDAAHGAQERAALDSLATRFPLLRAVDWAHAYEVTLYPGDVLYIPPLAMHYADALTDAVGLSVYTASRANAHSRAAERLPLPFDADAWSDETMAIAVAVFLRLVAERLALPEPARCAAGPGATAGADVCAAEGASATSALVERLLASRYVLWREVPHASATRCFASKRALGSNSQLASESAPDQEPTLLLSCSRATLWGRPDVVPPRGAHLRALNEKFKRYANDVADRFAAISGSNATREVWLADYIERLVYATLGPRRHGAAPDVIVGCSTTLGGRSIVPYLRAVAERC